MPMPCVWFADVGATCRRRCPSGKARWRPFSGSTHRRWRARVRKRRSQGDVYNIIFMLSGVLALIGPRTRLATHLDVSAADIDRAIAAFGAFFR